VYKSSDNGTTWTNLSSGLPDIPVNDIVIDTFDNLFLGTDIGVLVSGDDGVNWTVAGTNLPSVVVTDMHLHVASGFLYVATYGRSSYKIDVGSDILNIDPIEDDILIKVYPNPVTDYVTVTIAQGNYSSTLYNQLGQKLITKDLSSGSQKIDMSNLAQGIYHLQVTQGTKKKVFRLLKR